MPGSGTPSAHRLALLEHKKQATVPPLPLGISTTRCVSGTVSTDRLRPRRTHHLQGKYTKHTADRLYKAVTRQNYTPKDTRIGLARAQGGGRGCVKKVQWGHCVGDGEKMLRTRFLQTQIV